MDRFVRLVPLLAFVLLQIPIDSFAEEVPLWEAGVGLSVIDFPDYRGSDERTTYVLPLPYFVYRGKILKIDGERVRGLFFKSDRIELDVSLSGSVPVKSSNNTARQGMPDLDASLEIGPSINILLAQSEQNKVKFELRLPLRPVIDIHLDYLGYVFQPQLNLDIHDLGRNGGWNLGLATGPIFANQRYNQYFYGVAPEYATPDRPTYMAHGGYSGSQFIAALSKRYPNYWVGGFVKWDTLQGAVFSDSPLVKSEQNFSAGLGISWIFARSKRRVQN